MAKKIKEQNPTEATPTDEEKPTYYSLHAEELKLLQFLLYHLRHKSERKQVTTMTIENKIHRVDF